MSKRFASPFLLRCNGGMNDVPPPATVLDEDECWRLLATQHIARLAIITPEGPDIFPIDYMPADRRIAFRTAPGEKLARLGEDPRVALEVEGRDELGLWSVVLRGTARRLAAEDEIQAIGVLDLETTVPGGKWNFVAVTPQKVTGRRFPGATRDS